MKEAFILEVTSRMARLLTPGQLDELARVLDGQLAGKEVVECRESRPQEGEQPSLVELFLSAKSMEGCSERTIRCYRAALSVFAGECGTGDVRLAYADSIRAYLTAYQRRNGCSNATLDKIRRVLSSFFGWLEAGEDALTGCNYRMMFRDFGFAYEMGYGKNVIEFTPEKAGIFQYTCWMGMVRGVVKVVD